MLLIVELGGKWCGRRPNCFISVSKKDLSDAFVFSVDDGDMLFGLFRKKSNGAIFIYTRQYSEVLRPSCLTTVFFCRFAIPFKQTVFEAFTDLKGRVKSQATDRIHFHMEKCLNKLADK